MFNQKWHEKVPLEKLQLLWGAVSRHHLYHQAGKIIIIMSIICISIYQTFSIICIIHVKIIIIIFITRIRRRPLFYVFNMIMPCVLINGIGGYHHHHHRCCCCCCIIAFLSMEYVTNIIIIFIISLIIRSVLISWIGDNTITPNCWDNQLCQLLLFNMWNATLLCQGAIWLWYKDGRKLSRPGFDVGWNWNCLDEFKE